VAGDFNDYTRDASLRMLRNHGLVHVSATARGTHGARGTYRYQGEWGSLDHIFCDEETAARLVDCHVNDAPFLLVDDEKYGGKKPRRNYQGPRYLDGVSDHLPLVAVFRWTASRAMWCGMPWRVKSLGSKINSYYPLSQDIT
jgi:predicted extracellular nuclease